MDGWLREMAKTLKVNVVNVQRSRIGLLTMLPAYGISGQLCELIASFIKCPSMKVVVNGFCSETKSNNAGLLSCFKIQFCPQCCSSCILIIYCQLRTFAIMKMTARVMHVTPAIKISLETRHRKASSAKTTDQQ